MAQLDAPAFRDWVARARRALDAHRDELNRLNVFPVPDGDTGTNLTITWQAVARATEESAATAVGALARAAARGALMSARGNSGVIVAQLLGGFANALAGVESADGRLLARAISRAAEEVDAAVAAPADGTAITVLQAAADAATADGGDAVPVSAAAATAATIAVAATTDQNDVLRSAGVIDAGGRGIELILDALSAALTGRAEEHRTAVGQAAIPAGVVTGGPAYEVTYLLDAPTHAVAKLRERLQPMGDSLVIAGGEGLWNIHVHVDDVAAAIEAGIDAGRPHRLTVTRFADAPGHVEPVHHAEEFAAPEAPDEYAEEATPPRPRRALIAVSDGHGTVALMRELGAHTIPGPLPSATDLVRAIELTEADEVVLLGGDPRMTSVVQAAAESSRTSTRDVSIVPTRSPLQGLVALSVADPGRALAEDVTAMVQAAAACRVGGVSMQGGRAHSTVDGGRAVPAVDVAAGAIEVVSRLIELGGESITLLLGRDAPPRVGEAVRDAFPAFTVEVLDGGQSDPVVAIGVE